MTDPNNIPTGFPKRTRNIYLLIIAIGTVFYSCLYTFILLNRGYEPSPSVLLCIGAATFIWLVIIPVLSFIMGLLVALLPYKNNPYRKKYLRASLLSWMAIFVVWPLLLLLFYIFDPFAPTEECDCVDKTKGDSIAAVEAYQAATIEHFYALADEKNTAVIPSIDSVLAMTNEQMKEKNIFYTNDGKAGLHYLKGELYYNAGNYVYALKEFQASDDAGFEQARVACYIQLKRYFEAEALLRSQMRYDVALNSSLGNLFEITGNVDSAKAAYQRESNSYTAERLNELNKKHPVLLTGFPFPSHRPH